MNALHQSLSNESYTPSEIADAVAELFGDRPDLDPASCELANTIMKARYIFTKADDSLNQDWLCGIPFPTVFLNPPGGCVKQVDGKWIQALRRNSKGEWVTGAGRSSQSVWWEKLLSEWKAGRVSEAVFLAFNLNSAIALCPDMAKFPCCFTSASATSPCISGGGRIKFLAEKSPGVLAPQGSPTHPNLLVYLPRSHSEIEWVSQSENFQAIFSQFGEVIKPAFNWQRGFQPMRIAA